MDFEEMRLIIMRLVAHPVTITLLNNTKIAVTITSVDLQSWEDEDKQDPVVVTVDIDTTSRNEMIVGTERVWRMSDFRHVELLQPPR